MSNRVAAFSRRRCRAIKSRFCPLGNPMQYQTAQPQNRSLYYAGVNRNSIIGLGLLALSTFLQAQLAVSSLDSRRYSLVPTPPRRRFKISPGHNFTGAVAPARAIESKSPADEQSGMTAGLRVQGIQDGRPCSQPPESWTNSFGHQQRWPVLRGTDIHRWLRGVRAPSSLPVNIVSVFRGAYYR